MKAFFRKIGGRVFTFRNQITSIVLTVLVLVLFWYAGTRFDSLIHLISAVAWPLVVVAFICIFRTNVGTMIDRFLGGEIAGAKFNFAMIDAAKAESLRITSASNRRPTEYKIMNTLILYQADNWPNFEASWAFWIPPGVPEYPTYLESKGKLIGEKLIAEMNDSNRGILLTLDGLKWCRENSHEMGPAKDHYDYGPINEEKLKKVLTGELGPKIDK